jgi:alanine dehydrogenase
MLVLILGRREVEQLLPAAKCVDLMEDVLKSLVRGEVMLPLRQILLLPGSPNLFALMPAHSEALHATGAKLITVFPGNHGSGVDSHQGAVVLFDGKNGSVKAVIDGAAITAIRTGAASGAATRVLANNDASVLGILGSGVQARGHVEAMVAVRPIKKIIIWSVAGEQARSLAADITKRHGIETAVVPNAEDAVKPADIVCTVTSAPAPVLQGEWLRPGTHVNAIGAFQPTTRELDTEAITRARLFTDRRESALTEAGDILIPIKEGAITADHLLGEVGEVLLGKVPGRQRPTDITVFKSLGIAVEDLASAHYLYDVAKREKVGTWAEF